MLMGTIDVLVFLAYIVAVIVMGFWTGKGRRESTEDYFLAGRSLPWYAVGASFIGSNISTEHFIGMVGAAYTYGICVANWEWLNVWTFTILIWIFIPFLLGTRVFSAPEFLERRFNPTCRLLFAVLTVIASIVAFLAAVLYAGAVGVDAIFNIQGFLQTRFGVSATYAPFVANSLCILFIAGSTGCYAIFGGLNSVVWTDVFQVVVMFIGGILVTILGLCSLGNGDPVAGWHAMIAANSGADALHAAAIARKLPDIIPNAVHYNRLSMFQPIGHTAIPWPMIFLIWLSISVWYNCINQFMIQRVLAAKDRWHARMGIVFSGFMKILLPFMIVIPGLIMFTMDPKLPDPDKSYPILVHQLIPMGLKGLVLATLFGAIQSTISSVLNSTSTVITLDIYHRFMVRRSAPAVVVSGGGGDVLDRASPGLEYDEQTDRQTVRIGQMVSIAVLLIAMVMAPFIGLLNKGVFIYIQNLYAHFAPPFSAVFIVGMLWKRANARSAVAAIISGLALSILCDLVVSKYIPFVQPFLVRATLIWFYCVILMVVVSLLTEEPPAEKVTDDTTINWRKLSIVSDLGDRWYKSVTLWWLLYIAGTVACYVIYSGLF